MSALPNYELFLDKEERFDEAETLKTIGRVAVSARDELTGVGELMEAALLAPGIRKIKIEGGRLLSLFGSLSWSLDGSASLVHDSIPVPVKANGRQWGELRVWFDSRTSAAESIRKLGAFLGQQFGLQLNRLILTREIEERQKEASGLLRRLDLQKKLHRAANYVATTRNLSHTEAIQFVVNRARLSPTSLSQIADALIVEHEAGKRTRILRHSRGQAATA